MTIYNLRQVHLQESEYLLLFSIVQSSFLCFALTLKFEQIHAQNNSFAFVRKITIDSRYILHIVFYIHSEVIVQTSEANKDPIQLFEALFVSWDTLYTVLQFSKLLQLARFSFFAISACLSLHLSLLSYMILCVFLQQLAA